MRAFPLGALAAALLVGVASLVGCGGDDSEDSESRQPAQTSADTRSGSDFVASLDSLCRRTRPELVRIQAQLVQARDAARSGQASLPATFSTFVTLLSRAESATARFSERLDALPAPSSERAFRKRVAGSVQAGRQNLRRQIRAAEAQDSVTLRELSIEGTTIDSERRGLFAGHGGFRSCAKGTTG
jgi:hypothetical protein